MSAIREISRIGSKKSPETISLRYSWEELRKNTPTKRRASTLGVDNLTIDEYHKDLDSRFQSLSKKILGKNFKFNKLKTHLIPKGTGKDRLICVFSAKWIRA